MKKRPLCLLFYSGLFLLLFACTGDYHTGYRAFPVTVHNTSQYITKIMAEKNMVGVSIALVDDGRIAWARGFGWADRENGVSARADTRYMLDSGSKTLTTVALLQLTDQGLLSLEKPATTYLSEFQLLPRFPGQMQDITVERLLNHHSGIPGDIYNGGFVEEAWNEWGCDLYTDWLFHCLANEYPSYAPGEISVYCNTGFVLAGEIARRLGSRSGETFNEFMIRQLFSPLDMRDTSFRASPGTMAVGYMDGEPVPYAETNCVFGATGGAVTTVLDMGRFLAMILNRGRNAAGEQIIMSDTVDRMGQGERTPLDWNSYSTPGLGLDTMDDPVMRYAGRAWTKNGSTGHFNSFMEILPDLNLAVIVLANSDTAQWAVYSIARKCLKQAVEEKTGMKPTLPSYPDIPSETNPAFIAGTYVKKNGYDRIADNLDGTLSWVKDAHTADPEVKTLTSEGDLWAVAGAPERLTFRTVSFMGMDHFVMIQVGSDTSVVDESVFGGYVTAILSEKLNIPAIPAAWAKRAGRRWLIDNIPFNDLNWDGCPFLAVEDVKGVLMVRQGANLQAMFPRDDYLAFVDGLANRNGSAVQVKDDAGMEKLQFVGYEAVPIEQAPLLSSGDAVSGTVEFHKTDWYRFDSPVREAEITFYIPDGADGYRLRLFNSDLAFPIAEGVDVISATVQEGAFYLAVCRTPDASDTYTLLVNP